jgi:hypothetical protein
MKQQANEHTFHTNEVKMYHGKSDMRKKTQLEGEAYAFLSFLQ